MSQIDHPRTPYPKPEKSGPKPKKYIKTKTDYQWIKTRKLYLEGRANHQGLYTCEMCGAYTDTPEIDHIQTRGARADLKYDPGNLRLLCPNCHRKRHHQIM